METIPNKLAMLRDSATIDNKFKAERLWTIDNLVDALGVKKSWVYDQTFRSKIPHRKIGGKLRFDPIEIDAWIECQPGCSLKISGGPVPNKEEQA